MFYALMERRWVRHKRNIFYAGIVASTLINLKVSSGDHISAEDFVPKVADPRDAARRNVMALFSMLDAKGLMPEDLEALRKRTVQGMLAQGITDADAVFESIFQSWDSQGNK
jgi:hypothetical protein